MGKNSCTWKFAIFLTADVVRYRRNTKIWRRISCRRTGHPCWPTWDCYWPRPCSVWPPCWLRSGFTGSLDWLWPANSRPRGRTRDDEVRRVAARAWAANRNSCKNGWCNRPRHPRTERRTIGRHLVPSTTANR